MKSLKCKHCVYPGVMSKRPFGFQCPSCQNTVDIDLVDLDLETYRLQEFIPQVLICEDDRTLIGFDLAEEKDQTVVLIGAGNSGINTAAVIASLQQLGYSVIKATEAVEAFSRAIALPEINYQMDEYARAPDVRSMLIEHEGPHHDGWYRKFENKRRWRK